MLPTLNSEEANNGTSTDTAFKTIQKARDVVRTINSNMTGDIIVNLRGGTHTLSSTFTLGASDSGNHGYNIIYQAYGGEAPVISGGQRITGWTLHDSRKHIYKASVGTSIDTRQIYVNGVRAIRATSRFGGQAGVSLKAINGDGYDTSGNSIASWGNIGNIEVCITVYFRHTRGPVASATSNHIVMKQPFWRNVNKKNFGPTAWASWLENAYELLDSEGEWYLNRTDGYLYYKPKSGEDMSIATVILAKLETLVSGSKVNYVQFKGMKFSYATDLTTNSANGFPCTQADECSTNADQAQGPGAYNWQAPGNVKFDHSTHLRIDGCTFEHLGMDGLQLYIGCQCNVVYNNIFQDISGTGISIGGVWIDRNPADSEKVVNNTVDNNASSLFSVGSIAQAW